MGTAKLDIRGVKLLPIEKRIILKETIIATKDDPLVSSEIFLETGLEIQSTTLKFIYDSVRMWLDLEFLTKEFVPETSII